MSRLPFLSHRRAGVSWIGISGVLGVAVVIAGAAMYFMPDGAFTPQAEGPLTAKVKRGAFVHELIERGEVESAGTVDVRCEVASRNTGGVTILELVPEGTRVKAGDVIGKLDSSGLEAELAAQQIVCNGSAAALIQARTTYDTAIIAKQEYLEGTFKNEEQLIQQEIFQAEEDLRRAEQYLKYSEQLAAKNFVTPLTLEADRFAVEKAKKVLDAAKTKLYVLQNLTKQKMLGTLDAAIKTAESQLRSVESSHQIDLDKLEFIKSQIEKCTLRAPQDGEVTYAAPTDYRDSNEVIIKEGAVVRERQVIIRLPNPDKMQVNAKVNESKIRLIKIGMPARIKVEAFAGAELEGTVTKVFAYANRSRWSASTVKDFSVIVEIKDPPYGLRTGSSAEVRIRVDQAPDELLAPVQAILEHGGKYYCVWNKGEQWEAKPVELGSTNGAEVVVLSGVNENDNVVLNPRAYLDKLNLPPIMPETLEFDPKQMVANDGESAGASAEAAQGPSGDGNAAPAQGGPRAGNMLQTFDKNGDGRLSADEVPPQMAGRFTSGDKNGDGFLDADEISALPRSRRPGGAPPDSEVGGGAGQ